MDSSCQLIGQRVQTALQRSNLYAQPAPAPQVARQLLKQAGAQVASTLDGALQRFAQDNLRQQLASLRERNVNDGAIIVLDNRSGEILAYVGNAGGSEVDGVHGAAPGRLDPETVFIWTGDRTPLADGGVRDGRHAARYRHRCRHVRAAKLRPQFQGPCQRPHQPGQLAQYPGRAHGAADGPGQFLQSLEGCRPGQLERAGRILRPLAGAGLVRSDPAGTGQRLPRAGQWRPLQHRQRAAAGRPAQASCA